MNDNKTSKTAMEFAAKASGQTLEEFTKGLDNSPLAKMSRLELPLVIIGTLLFAIGVALCGTGVPAETGSTLLDYDLINSPLINDKR